MGGPYKLKKRGKPMTTIYDAAILLVDDNPDLLTLVTDNLRTAGYKTVCTAADCAAARAAFAAHRPDLMILDTVIGQPLQQGALGGGQGQRCAVGAADGGVLQIDRAVPQRQHPAAAQLGAVGALQKVLHAQKQLLHQERLGQIVVCAKPQPEQPVRVGVPRREKQRRDVRFCPQGAEQPEAVAVRQVDVHIVTYDAVCEAVWGADYYGYENSLNVHIRHLREKIEPDPGHPQWLLTVRGIGYRLTGEV